ncbi:hypothetical protein AB4Z51_18500 [Bradyrhizobium sp. 2TAF36]|uniref:hypothetical protein n=1 Tax=Bradyrhizobium sp. 2TAF36 TaxID=3233016 RepID=UPI003F8FF3AC
MSRYSQLYIDQTAPLPDSARARHRLGKLMENVMPDGHTIHLSNFLESELGIKVGATYPFHWLRLTEKCATRDLLDIVTLTARYLKLVSGATRWLDETRRIFSEERLAYEIDETAVVHPAVDREFWRNRQATVAGLQMPRYANSRAAFERVSDELAADPPNGKDAWRATFTAVEGLFRLMFPSATQLNAGAVETLLAPVVQRQYANDPVALRAATKQLASLKDWVDASHNYRHEPGSEEPVQPPIDLAVLAISNGTSFLRWLIVLDQMSSPRP